MNTASKILVLGLGESGLAMARWAARQGNSVRVADSRAQPPNVAELLESVPASEVVSGPFSQELLTGVTQLALSPGLSTDLPLVKQARASGVEVLGEIELFARALLSLPPKPVIAITGTNGKTTTTTLTGELCRAAGMDAAVAGNISPSALTELMRRCDEERLPDIWVLELSSFQLETTMTLYADVATVLNISEDHLDRHVTMAAYARAKTRIFSGGGVQVLNRDDQVVSLMALPGRARRTFGLRVSENPLDYGVRTLGRESWLAAGREPLIATSRLQLSGQHNVANALAALALCEALGLPRQRLLKGLVEFKGLPHRVQLVARRADDTEFVNDSKGTNVGATLAAIQTMERPVILIAGGDGKRQDFSPLRDAVARHARAVVLIGQDALLIAEALEGTGVGVMFAEDMDDAVSLASEAALPGDVILLSPACACGSMFRNYVHRAAAFCAAASRQAGVRPL